MGLRFLGPLETPGSKPNKKHPTNTKLPESAMLLEKGVLQICLGHY